MVAYVVAEMEPITVKRKIQFYSIDVGANASGKPHPFDPTPYLRSIDQLPFSSQGRYSKDDRGHDICCWVDDSTPYPAIRLGRIRRDDLPQMEHEGRLAPLPLPPQYGIAESVHILFFPDNLVGIDFNFHGPRITRLAPYLAQKAHCPGITFLPLLRPDVAQQLERFEDVHLFRIKIHASYAAQLAKGKEYEQSEDGRRLFQTMADLATGQVVDFVVQRQPRSHDVLPHHWLDVARRLVSNVHLRQGPKGLLAAELKGFNGETGDVELVDLLSAQFAVTKEIPCSTHTKALDTQAAYHAIAEAYEERKDELRMVASYRICAGGPE